MIILLQNMATCDSTTLLAIWPLDFAYSASKSNITMELVNDFAVVVSRMHTSMIYNETRVRNIHLRGHHWVYFAHRL